MSKHNKLCALCGAPFQGRGYYCCPEHGITALKEFNRQLKLKKGPIYEKWKANLKAHFD